MAARLLFLLHLRSAAASDFVRRRGATLFLGEKRFRFGGANLYWCDAGVCAFLGGRRDATHAHNTQARKRRRWSIEAHPVEVADRGRAHHGGRPGQQRRALAQSPAASRGSPRDTLKTLAKHTTQLQVPPRLLALRAPGWGQLRRRWRHVLGVVAAGGLPKLLVAADGMVSAGSDDHKLYGIPPAGQVKCTATTGDAVYSSPAIAADGTVTNASPAALCSMVTASGWRLTLTPARKSHTSLPP